MEVKQNADGSVSFIRERDSAEMDRVGGVTGAAGSNSPAYEGQPTIAFNIGGGTDTGGGLLQWQNELGYDIVVTGAVLDATTVAAATCTVSFGQAAASTTVSHNMISGQDVHAATGTFTSSAPISVKVANTTWITGSAATGSSSGLVARAYFNYVRSPAAGGI